MYWRRRQGTTDRDDQPMAPATARGLDAVAARTQKWCDMNPDIAAALEHLEWRDILRIPGVPSADGLLLHRIKGARLTGWTRSRDAVCCPHCPEAGPGGGSLDHILWTCPQAQRLWRALSERWATLYSTRWDERTLLRSVFELRLAYIPDLVWVHPELARLPRPTPADTSATHQALHAVWSLQVLATFHVLLRWRTEPDTPDTTWSPAQGLAYHDGCLRATMVSPRWHRTPDSAASCHTAAAIEILRQTDPDRGFRSAAATPDTAQQYVLFFDGGSRGNPGPGGSGAVIVRASHNATQASIVWSAATSAARPTMTNNQAEYEGLVTGLREAQRQRWIPLEVVGDSQLILRQIQDYRPPKNQRLLAYYAEARRLGDTLGVRRWQHHLRAYNKMADAAANLAMDTKSSSQVQHPMTRARHAALQQHLGTDFAHWQENFFTRLEAR